LVETQIGTHADDGLRARLATPPEIEYEARVTHYLASEPGCWNFADAQELFDFS